MGPQMGWVVKSWRVDGQQIAAGREVADARAYLEALEQVGVETRRQVREQRRALRAPSPPEPAPRAPRRAVLRESPLTELFRATAQG
jgi:hypothetical protein